MGTGLRRHARAGSLARDPVIEREQVGHARCDSVPTLAGQGRDSVALSLQHLAFEVGDGRAALDRREVRPRPRHGLRLSSGRTGNGPSHR